jgi:SNF2 family DNA or RNA helicase
MFDDLQPGSLVRGLAPNSVAEILQISRFGPDALNLVYRADGKIGERLLYRGEESAFEPVKGGRAYAFDADGGLKRLASEASRIRLAHLFDPYLAVSASQIEALPHQITAVYGEMLTRQPLRFLLADDPGAGKTVMAGLLIKELMIRSDLERCLIVAPGNLVEQWQEELAGKFSLGFDLLTRDQIETSFDGVDAYPFRMRRNSCRRRFKLLASNEA